MFVCSKKKEGSNRKTAKRIYLKKKVGGLEIGSPGLNWLSKRISSPPTT